MTERFPPHPHRKVVARPTALFRIRRPVPTTGSTRRLPALAPFVDKRVKRAALGSSEDELLRTSDPTVRVGARITVDGVTYDTTDPDTVLPEGIVTGSILGSAPSGKGTTVIIDRTRLEPFRYRRK